MEILLVICLLLILLFELIISISCNMVKNRKFERMCDLFISGSNFVILLSLSFYISTMYKSMTQIVFWSLFFCIIVFSILFLLGINKIMVREEVRQRVKELKLIEYEMNQKGFDY